MITDPNPGIHARIVPMDVVLGGGSVDSIWYDSDDGDVQTVEEVLAFKRKDKGYAGLLNSIREHGFDLEFAPAWTEWAGLKEGHHRIAALVDLGAKWCPVQEGRRRGEYFELPDGTRPGACAYHGDGGCPDGPAEGGCWFEDEGW